MKQIEPPPPPFFLFFPYQSCLPIKPPPTRHPAAMKRGRFQRDPSSTWIGGGGEGRGDAIFHRSLEKINKLIAEERGEFLPPLPSPLWPACGERCRGNRVALHSSQPLPGEDLLSPKMSSEQPWKT